MIPAILEVIMSFPKNLAEARTYRYGGNAISKSAPFKPDRCAAEVSTPDGWHFMQCSRKPGYGPDSLFCKQHAKIAEKG